MDCQGGHYLNKTGYPATYFDEDNVRPQCSYCNRRCEGRHPCFREGLISEIGADRVEALEQRRHGKLDWTREVYIERIKHYQELLHIAGYKA